MISLDGLEELDQKSIKIILNKQFADRIPEYYSLYSNNKFISSKMKIRNDQTLNIGEIHSNGTIKVSITVDFNGMFESGKEEWIFEQTFDIQP